MRRHPAPTFRIVEDWSTVDTLELLRRLGFWRTMLVAPKLLGALRC